jgi:hypothetical protein
MKKTVTIIAILFTIYSNAQLLGLGQFEGIYKLENIEKQSDYLYRKGFSKDVVSTKDESLFYKRKFIKFSQSYDEEIVIIKKDTIKYLLTYPQEYSKLKGDIKGSYKRTKGMENASKMYFHTKKEIMILDETNLKRDYNEQPIKFYTLIYHRKPKD